MQMSLNRNALSLALAAGIALAAGCAKRPTQEPVPTPEPMAAATPQAEPTPIPPRPTPVPTAVPNSYIVQPGDSLWRIAGDPVVFGNSFRWPLLFKANRDQIIDPDLIEPAQDLTWKHSYSYPELEDAEQKAKDTPPYVPHVRPRKQLPLKY
jgi:hypothetical protein